MLICFTPCAITLVVYIFFLIKINNSSPFLKIIAYSQWSMKQGSAFIKASFCLFYCPSSKDCHLHGLLWQHNQESSSMDLSTQLPGIFVSRFTPLFPSLSTHSCFSYFVLDGEGGLIIIIINNLFNTNNLFNK